MLPAQRLYDYALRARIPQERTSAQWLYHDRQALSSGNVVALELRKERKSDKAVIHIGETPKWHGVPFPFPGKADGVTVNNNIYFRKGAYDPSTPEGLGLLAHELFHVRQYRTHEMTPASYLREAMRHGTFMDNKFEAPAYRFGDAVRDYFASHGTN